MDIIKPIRKHLVNSTPTPINIDQQAILDQITSSTIHTIRSTN